MSSSRTSTSSTLLAIAPGFYALKPSTQGLERGSAEFKKADTACSRWRAWYRKRLIVDHFGGRCNHCGFVGHLGAYHVHHTRPVEKVHGRARGSTRFVSGHTSATRLTADELEELNGCVLLCANCHSLQQVGSNNEHIRIVNGHTGEVATWDEVWDYQTFTEES